MIFGSKSECSKCHTRNPGREKLAAREQGSAAPVVAQGGRVPDWKCNTCNMMIWGSKPECAKCHTPNPARVAALPVAAPAPVVEPAARGGGGGGHLPDWVCVNCNMVIWGSKSECIKCHTRNPGAGILMRRYLFSLYLFLSSFSAQAPVGLPPVAKEGGRDEQNGARECVVCFDAAPTFVGKECGHRCVCQTCSTKVSACPVCRTNTAWIKLFDV